MSGLSELAREEGGRILIAHMRDIKESADSRTIPNVTLKTYQKLRANVFSASQIDCRPTLLDSQLMVGN